MSDARPLAVVLVSGGMDSCVTAAIAASQYRLAVVHSSYGQRTETKERLCFEEIANHFRAEHRLHIEQRYLARIGGSALTDTAIEVPEADPSALGSGGIPVTYVPFRNAHFLVAAVSWAEVLGATKVFIGAVEQDSSGYPDCRPEYYEAFQTLIRRGTRPETRVEICTPLIALSKAQIIRRGVELSAPFHLTWSCYRETEIACGLCDSCVLRLRAFEQAGIPDPIPYAPNRVSAGS